MAEIAQPRGAVDGGAGVVAFITQLDLAGMHPICNRIGANGARCNSRAAATASDSAGKRRHKAVTFALLDRAHPVMDGDGLRHCV